MSITGAVLLAAGVGCGDGASSSGSGGSAGGAGGTGGIQQTSSSGGATGGTTASGGTGGATGGTTASGGATGGTGGATGGTGGATGGTGGGDPALDQAACEALCKLGTCVDGVCSYPSINYVSAGVTRTTLPNGDISASSNVIGCHEDPVALAITALGAEGPCWVITNKLVSGAPALTDFDGGTMSLSDATAGSVTLTANSCMLQAWGGGAAFSAGEMVTFEATGGADLPATTLTKPAPNDLTISAGDFKAGDPLTITWAPAAPPDVIELIGNDGTLLFCTPSDPSSLTVSGAMTAIFGAQSVNPTLLGARYGYSKHDVPGGAPFWLYLSSTATQTLKQVN